MMPESEKNAQANRWTISCERLRWQISDRSKKHRRSTCGGSDADRGDQAEPSFMPLVLALATPQTVFVILTSEVPT